MRPTSSSQDFLKPLVPNLVQRTLEKIGQVRRELTGCPGAHLPGSAVCAVVALSRRREWEDRLLRTIQILVQVDTCGFGMAT